jgi:hypothetical protein
MESGPPGAETSVVGVGAIGELGVTVPSPLLQEAASKEMATGISARRMASSVAPVY